MYYKVFPGAGTNLLKGQACSTFTSGQGRPRAKGKQGKLWQVQLESNTVWIIRKHQKNAPLHRRHYISCVYVWLAVLAIRWGCHGCFFAQVFCTLLTSLGANEKQKNITFPSCVPHHSSFHSVPDAEEELLSIWQAEWPSHCSGSQTKTAAPWYRPFLTLSVCDCSNCVNRNIRGIVMTLSRGDHFLTLGIFKI